MLLPVSEQPIEERFQHHAIQVFEAVRELLRQNTGAHTLLQVVCPAQGQERLYTALAGLLLHRQPGEPQHRRATD